MHYTVKLEIAFRTNTYTDLADLDFIGASSGSLNKRERLRYTYTFSDINRAFSVLENFAYQNKKREAFEFSTAHIFARAEYSNVVLVDSWIDKETFEKIGDTPLGA